MEKRQQFMSEIVNATMVVHSQLNRLRALEKKFATMEGSFCQQIAANIKSGNNSHAKILANELSNLRRVRRTTQHMSLALEALVIRFSTINEFANILDTIDPTVEMIRGIHLELAKALPYAGQAISEIASVTSDVLIDANIRADVGRISTPADPDAFAILNEIEGVLEDEAKAKLPVPNTIPAQMEKEEEQTENRVMIES